MSEGYAIIISSVISVGGIVIVQIINYLWRKRDTKDRFFFETYQKRIEVYDEAIIDLDDICEKGKIFIISEHTSDTIYSKILTDTHRLNILHSKLIYIRFIILLEKTIMEFGSNLSRETAAKYIDKEVSNILKELIKDRRVRNKKKD